MTKDEYNKIRKEQAERDKRLRARFPLGPNWVHEYIDINLPLDEYKKEVKKLREDKNSHETNLSNGSDESQHHYGGAPVDNFKHGFKIMNQEAVNIDLIKSPLKNRQNSSS